jgi:S-adenosylmethionine:tRNA ribosyltransferase-isomerase
VKTSDLEYELPPELIAQYPPEERGDSRLLVLERSSQNLMHCSFADLPELVAAEDLFVLNNTRVIPARLFGRKSGLDREIEVLLLKEVQPQVWETLVKPGRRVPPGTQLLFGADGFSAMVLAGRDPSKRLLRFDSGWDFWEWVERMGEVPLPPYIRRSGSKLKDFDKERYQTVYAKEGLSVAAPTAGLHFNHSILEKLRTCEITLHVGYGTFKPISSARLEEHTMETENYSISEEAAREINRCKQAGRRTIAVGTTTTRALEHVAAASGRVIKGSGSTGLFIYPGHQFRAIQGLLTNFHLPGSSLLALVFAFAGEDFTRRAYREAIANRYRFYSYGDAMLVI